MKQKTQKNIQLVAREQLTTKKKFRKWVRKGVGKEIYSGALSAQKEAKRNFSQKLRRLREEMEWRKKERERREGQRYWWQH